MSDVQSPTPQKAAIPPSKPLKIAAKSIELPPLPDDLTGVPNDSSKAKMKRSKVVYYRETIAISDHAVLQFLGKKMGFNPEEIKASLLTGKLRTAIGKNAKSARSLGVTWRISNGRVVGIEKSSKKA